MTDRVAQPKPVTTPDIVERRKKLASAVIAEYGSDEHWPDFDHCVVCLAHAYQSLAFEVPDLRSRLQEAEKVVAAARALNDHDPADLFDDTEEFNMLNAALANYDSTLGGKTEQ